MFPNLPPFAPSTEPFISRVADLGVKGGLMDAHDPRVTVSNPLAANDNETPHPYPGLAMRNIDNPNANMSVGFTFLGSSSTTTSRSTDAD
jgi:hypothetical protein